MAPKRVFLGTAADATALTADWCRSQWPETLPPGLVFCIPTALAGRRLRDALADAYGAYQGVRFLTPALLVSLFEPPEEALPATETEVLMAWEQVFEWLRGEGAETPLFARLFPGGQGWLAQTLPRLAAARRLSALRTALAEAALDFGRVAAAGEALPEGQEGLRWQALDLLETRYREILAEHGLTDPCDLQQATLEARRPKAQEAGPLRIVMACVPDFMPALTRLLDTLPDLTVLIAYGPDETAFDAYGRPVPGVWNAPDRTLSVATGSICRCTAPAGAAAEAERFLNRFGSLSPRQLCFGILDRNMMPQFTAMAARHGMELFEPEPLPLRTQPEGRALSALLAYAADGPTEPALTALADIPETASALEPAGFSQTDLRRDLAILRSDFFPEDCGALLAFAESRRLPAVHALIVRAEGWRQALTADTAAGIRGFLTDLWGSRMLSPAAEPTRFAAFEAIGALLREAEECRIPGTPSPALFAARLNDISLRPVRRSADASFEGRLELLWSPADVALIGGVSETLFPDSLPSDPFLPDGLRTALGMRDDAMRTARDAYILDVLCRRFPADRIRLICSDTDCEGNGLRPSRLLFRCSGEARRERAQRLFIDSPAPRPTPLPESGIRLLALPSDVPPRPPVIRISASDIALFLRSPADYFLRSVLGLRPPEGRVSDDGLPGSVFGSLMHTALSVLKDSAGDPAAALTARCDALIRSTYGDAPTMEILALRRDLMRRLRKAADWEAASRAEGWRIAETEYSLETALDIDGTPVTLVGRIDRIDRHPDGRRRIVDYKTGAPKNVSTMHYRSSKGTPGQYEWASFQLPLYIWMLGRCRPDYAPEGNLSAGYLFLPKNKPPQFSPFSHPVSPEDTFEDLRGVLSRMLRIGELIRDPAVAATCSDPLLADLIRRYAASCP